MDIKSILCVFGGAPHELNALNTALTLAEAHAARVRVLHISPEPQAYPGLYGEAAVVGGEVVVAIEKGNKERLAAARQYVASFAARHRIPLDADDMPIHHASARFLHRTGSVDEAITREGRRSDLIVLGRSPKPLDASDDFIRIAAAVFNTGRPVLLMPGTEEKAFTQWQDRTVALAWNGSLEAARALWGAMPLLERAEKLHVLMAHGRGDTIDIAAEGELIAYCQAHGVHADVVSVERGSRGDAETILTKARELGVGLLAMGAYGHSMFREMILGGFTEDMLKKADIPLLLSH